MILFSSTVQKTNAKEKAQIRMKRWLRGDNGYDAEISTADKTHNLNLRRVQQGIFLYLVFNN